MSLGLLSLVVWRGCISPPLVTDAADDFEGNSGRRIDASCKKFFEMWIACMIEVIIGAVLDKMWIDCNSGGELGLMMEHDDGNARSWSCS